MRISAVEALTGLSRTTIYDWSAQGRFPRSARLSARTVAGIIFGIGMAVGAVNFLAWLF